MDATTTTKDVLAMVVDKLGEQQVIIFIIIIKKIYNIYYSLHQNAYTLYFSILHTKFTLQSIIIKKSQLKVYVFTININFFKEIKKYNIVINYELF